MLPVKLHLRNFMSYRGSENLIDFSGIHLACLTGDNGQGKSTLLDAMTWALWGKARARRDDDLITHGEKEMEVQLEFELGEQRYRVIRKRSAAGRGSSILELQGRTSTGFYTSLSEPTMRETQQRLNQLLRIDYDTFVNSAFLLQGRADEFTTRRPAERKQILADILGLAEYDRYAEEARGRARIAEERRARAEGDLEQIRLVVSQIPLIEEELMNAEGRARSTEGELRAAHEHLHSLHDQRRELDAHAESLLQAERRAKESRGEIAKAQGRLQELRSKVEHFDRLLLRAGEIESAILRLNQARAEKERWDELLQKSLQLQNEASGLQGIVNRERAVLEADLRGAENACRTHQDALDRHSKKGRDLAEAQKQVELLERVRNVREQYQETLNQRMEENGRLGAENLSLKKAMEDLKERMQLLEANDEANCPICRRPLSEEGRAEALADAQQEGTTMGNRYRDNQAAIRRVTDELKEVRNQITSADRQLSDLTQWQKRAAEAAQAAEEVRRVRLELKKGEASAAALRARLEAGDYAREQQEQLAALATVTNSLGYDKASHDQARQTIQALLPREEELRELNTAREQRAGIVEAIQSREDAVRAWQERVSSAEAEIAELNTKLAPRPQVLRRIQEQQVEVNRLQREATNAQKQQGAARQKLEDAERHAARQPEVERLCHAAVEERTIYDQLATAFGKRGVQAMIIESALPDIEQEANALLSRMTDGRMSVALSTQRETRSGDPMETLDVLIADENGERPYEMFSGGEAFRVNFALRIALSKLLAHRAGTNLRTLVMDEGFGSQDAAGRERLIEAITSIQDDFDRILIITHVEELKDAFPVRIDVVKGPQGSRVYVR